MSSSLPPFLHTVPSSYRPIASPSPSLAVTPAANFALGKFKHITDGDDPLTVVQNPTSDLVRKRTVGILDMGGGSLQIAFEITKENQWKAIQAEPKAKDFIAEFNLGNVAGLRH